MRTIAYIDGFNLYFGCLKESEYKWLDLVKLCERIAFEHNPNTDLVQVKFFTADVKANLSRHGQAAQHSQHNYHRALQSLYPSPQLEIIKGYHSEQVTTQPPYQEGDKRPRHGEVVKVWRIEEKQTDVNIAINMCCDAIEKRCDAMLVFSNDSDLVPAIEIVKAYQPASDVGVIIPRREGVPRLHNRNLSAIADWTRDAILTRELAECQLPRLVPTSKKPAIKPDYW